MRIQVRQSVWLDATAWIARLVRDSDRKPARGVVFAREAAAIELPPARFIADHPFVFVIRDVKRGNVVFVGRVTNPKA